MHHKFKVGDKVVVTEYGFGCIERELNTVVTITELGKYNGGCGYKVSPAIGNCISGIYGGLIGEESFELVTEIEGKEDSTYVSEELPPIGTVCTFVDDPKFEDTYNCSKYRDDWNDGDEVEILCHKLVEISGTPVAVVWNRRSQVSSSLVKQCLEKKKTEEEILTELCAHNIKVSFSCLDEPHRNLDDMARLTAESLLSDPRIQVTLLEEDS